eukprot:gene7243-14777_t
MHYDPEKNIITDPDSGEIILRIQNDSELPPEFYRIRKDYLFARQLEEGEVRSSRVAHEQHESVVRTLRLIGNGLERNTNVLPSSPEKRPPQPSRLEHDLLGMRSEIDNSVASNPTYVGGDHIGGPISRTNVATVDDGTLARTLQMMEFEIMDEIRHENGEDTDFNEKEIRASKCRRQLLTMSTLICFGQIGILIYMIQKEGYVNRQENPLIGPSALTMVKYGGKEAWLIIVKNEWWRLITPIFLHAGIIHIISNVFIQMRVGGYLNLVFGTPTWLIIYFASGIFGNMWSCIFLPDSVGVGSSGARISIKTEQNYHYNYHFEYRFPLNSYHFYNYYNPLFCWFWFWFWTYSAGGGVGFETFSYHDFASYIDILRL